MVVSAEFVTFLRDELAPLGSLSYVRSGRGFDVSFWRAADRLFDAHEELIAWSQAALAAAHRVAAKRGKCATEQVTANHWHRGSDP